MKVLSSNQENVQNTTPVKKIALLIFRKGVSRSSYISQNMHTQEVQWNQRKAK